MIAGLWFNSWSLLIVSVLDLFHHDARIRRDLGSIRNLQGKDELDDIFLPLEKAEISKLYRQHFTFTSYFDFDRNLCNESLHVHFLEASSQQSIKSIFRILKYHFFKFTDDRRMKINFAYIFSQQIFFTLIKNIFSSGNNYKNPLISRIQFHVPIDPALFKKYSSFIP